MERREFFKRFRHATDLKAGVQTFNKINELGLSSYVIDSLKNYPTPEEAVREMNKDLDNGYEFNLKPRLSGKYLELRG